MKKDWGYYAFVTTFLLVFVAVYLYSANKGRRVFNECMGSHITLWEGLFADLRLIDCPGKKTK